MKTLKMSIVMLLSLVLVITFSPIAYAQNVENITFETVSHMEEHYSEESLISPRFSCMYCETETKVWCRGEELMLSERDSHAIPQGGTCTVFNYISTSCQKCPRCHAEGESYQFHRCKEIHVGCGAGTVYTIECPGRYLGL